MVPQFNIFIYIYTYAWTICGKRNDFYCENETTLVARQILFQAFLDYFNARPLEETDAQADLEDPIRNTNREHGSQQQRHGATSHRGGTRVRRRAADACAPSAKAFRRHFHSKRNGKQISD